MLILGIAKGGLAGEIGLVAVPLMSMTVDPARAAAILLPLLMFHRIDERVFFRIVYASLVVLGSKLICDGLSASSLAG